MRIALVGNQNSGKTTLFNLLTGANQKVGNWPGVTIERKVGIIKGTDFEVVDLPGIYSLSPYTPEEEVSRKFVFDEKPDIIINIIDATSLERSLYLTTQLLELDVKVIIALNMTDILRDHGLTLDAKKLEEKLHTTVVEISALKRIGIDRLIAHLKAQDLSDNPHTPIFKADVEAEIALVKQHIETPHARFVAVKMLENDPMFMGIRPVETKASIERLNDRYHQDLEQIIASQRYDDIVNIRSAVVTATPVKLSITDKLDKVFLNRWAALPIFAAIMFLVYYLSVGLVGSATVDWVANGFGALGDLIHSALAAAGASSWAISLVVDGIVGGVGAILGFVPQLIILFICISLLETSGYMSRIAFFLDRLFRKFGLSGKSLIPFIVGSGCSVPAIMTTRTIEDQNERRMSVVLTPFIPCSAKLPILALFAGFFFPDQSGLVSFSLYLFAIVIILTSAYFLSRFYYHSDRSGFLSELPEYKLPSLRYVARDVWDKTWAFIKRAGTIILVSSVIIWVLTSFTWTFHYLGDGGDLSQSILAGIGNAFGWLFYPMLGGHYSWGATVAAFQGLVAKENVVSTMAVIAGVDGETGILAPGNVFGFFTPVTAYAFMVFNLFSAPCFGAIGAMKREYGSTWRTIKAVLFQTGLAWILASLIGGVGTIIANFM